MLSNEAYTFRRKSLLAIALSWVGGFTNVIALLTCGQTVSHQTGNTTHLGRGLGELIGGYRSGSGSGGAEAALAGFMVVFFFAGAASSGLLTEWARRSGRASRYVVPITIEAILLSLVVLALLVWPTPMSSRPIAVFTIVGLTCLAMGLQNGTITRISGSVVRTTHLTGVITDMGLESAQVFTWISRRHRLNGIRITRLLAVIRRQPSAQRLTLLTAIFTSFLLGVTVGTITEFQFGPIALLLPVVFLATLVIRQMLVQVAEIAPLNADDAIAAIAPPGISVFRLRPRKPGPHRLPDLLAWSEQLPASESVAVLMIDPLTQVDRNAAAALLMAMEAARARGRHLIVAGLTHRQNVSLRAKPGGQRVNLSQFAPDLEIALARAINLRKFH